ncbi:MAG: hypothetical protein MZW92_58030 [Comamonadaceae bacterium]|nr:hypothetical protein [Comamonadaceae bacterium]
MPILRALAGLAGVGHAPRLVPRCCARCSRQPRLRAASCRRRWQQHRLGVRRRSTIDDACASAR